MARARSRREVYVRHAVLCVEYLTRLSHAAHTASLWERDAASQIQTLRLRLKRSVVDNIRALYDATCDTALQR